MLPQELMQFPTSKLILLRGGIPPIIGDKIFHFKSRLFKKRAYPPPQVRPIGRRIAVAVQNPPVRKRADPKANASPVKPPKPTIIDIPGFAVSFHDVSTVRVGDKVTGTLDQGNEHG